jgi:hypothetical protein
VRLICRTCNEEKEYWHFNRSIIKEKAYFSTKRCRKCMGLINYKYYDLDLNYDLNYVEDFLKYVKMCKGIVPFYYLYILSDIYVKMTDDYRSDIEDIDEDINHMYKVVLKEFKRLKGID